MQAALKGEFVNVEDYLAGEEASEIKHEYIGGVVYAMAGVSRQHNIIAQNISSAFRAHIKGGPCQVLISDVKVCPELSDDVFYYPDVMVGCDPRDTHRLYLRYPKVIVEVASESTERLDRREKRLAYQAIETLEEYLLVSQDRLEITIFRRANQWNPEVFNQMEANLSLNSLGLNLPLAAIYEGAMPD